jgi:ribosomal protein S18 acetylase RimI-like enzyme
MEIRSLRTETELVQALALTAAAWREAFDHVLSAAELDGVAAATTSDVAAKFENLEAAAETAVLVAENDDDEVVGWLSMTWHPERTKAYAREGEADIRTLYVRPADWGDGVGTALLDAALARLPNAVDAVVLETFRANEQGRAFYESRGFAVRETAAHEVGENSYPSVILEREV